MRHRRSPPRAGTPCSVRPEYRALGSVDASPAIISEKKTPIDSDVPELKNVARMPDADPRWRAGTEFMIAVVFGAENRPEPMPFSTSRPAKAQ